MGHTDREGKASDNLTLSLERAQSVAAFLTDDVDAWLARYESDGSTIGSRRRWGAAEDEHLLAAQGYDPDDILAFQNDVDLPRSGELDVVTRRELIRRYMDLDGTSLPAGTSLTVVAAGEHFNAVATNDHVEEAENRRTELFFFPDAVSPMPSGQTLGPDSTEYAQWLTQADRTIDITAPTGDFDDPVPTTQVDPLLPEIVDLDVTRSDAPTDDPQRRTYIVSTEVAVANQDEPEVYRLGTVFDASSFELTGLQGDPTSPLSVGALRGAVGGASVIEFEVKPSSGKQRRRLSRTQTFFYDDGLGDKPLGAGDCGARALVFETRQMAMTHAQAADVLGPLFVGEDTPATVLGEQGRYLDTEGGWWVVSGRAVLDADRFFLPVASIDPFGHKSDLIEYDEDNYMVVKSTEVVGEFDAGKHEDADEPDNVTQIKVDYRVLQPSVVLDPNNTVSVTEFDALGMLSKQVTRGARLDQKIDHQAEDPFTLGDEGDDRDNPTRLYAYDLFAFAKAGKPVSSTVAAQIEYGPRTFRIALSKTFLDGSGAVLQKKVRDSNGKFRSTGLTVVNNKGAPVLQYRSFKSSSSGFEPRAKHLIATTRYDALGRAVQAEYPDGTLERVTFDAWHLETFDCNDTVTDSKWLDKAANGSPAERAAAESAVAHANTPTHVRLDSLGRSVATFARFHDEGGGEQVIVARQVLDVQGNCTEVIDARGNVAEKLEFGMLGQTLRTRSFDAGVSLAVADVAGKPLRAVDARGSVFRWTYDALQRPLEDFVRAANDSHEVLTTKRLYGDKENAKAVLPEMQNVGARRRGRLFRVYDGGGESTVVDYDIDGNPNLTMRRMTNFAKTLEGAQDSSHGLQDWSTLAGLTDFKAIDELKEPLLENSAFTSNLYFDAMGRAREVTTPASAVSHLYAYSDDGLLETVKRKEAGKSAKTVYEVLEFDEFGRPLRIADGKAAVRRYQYDDTTQRLVSLSATSGSGKRLRDLQYTYDPVGNITHVADKAHKTIFFDNAEVEAVNTYRYDALYRLVEATGREHDSQAGGRGPKQAGAQRVAAPNDPTRMRRYTQQFTYDTVGNIQRLRHAAANGSFTRHYEYSAYGNRLRATGRFDDLAERYEHDAQGNMTAMPHVDGMVWNALGQLQRVQRGTQTVHFQYAGGERIRKFVEKGGGIVEERLYLGSEEVFERRKGVGFEKVVERTLAEHVGSSLRIETKTIKAGKAVSQPKPLFRFQLADHLGSTGLEVDESGRVITYEEFHPYGTSSYRATSSEVEVSANRYRFTGMERDDETGLALHGARYYAPWLGRWTSADPIGLAGGSNRYRYCDGDPVGLSDRDGRAPGATEQAQAAQAQAAQAGDSLTPFSPVPAEPPDPRLATKKAVLRGEVTELGHALGMESVRNRSESAYDEPIERLFWPADVPRHAQRAPTDSGAYFQVLSGDYTDYWTEAGDYLGTRLNTDIGLQPSMPGEFLIDVLSGGIAGRVVQGGRSLLAAGRRALVSEGVAGQRGMVMVPFGKRLAKSRGVAGGSLRGAGPQPGVIEASSRTKSSAQLRNFDPRPNASYGGERTVEFVYDPATKRFAVGRAQGTGSPHQKLADAINPGYDPGRVVGGNFSRGPRGEILTNEYSGHFGENWTDAMRAEFVEFLEGATGQRVVHGAWPGG
ncbi:MAG: hypothetical protein JKY37_27030 [Nannocystaceae bacterium]|nr:hypothetical protein [Nannocystaceae bacterium]